MMKDHINTDKSNPICQYRDIPPKPSLPNCFYLLFVSLSSGHVVLYMCPRDTTIYSHILKS